MIGQVVQHLRTPNGIRYTRVWKGRVCVTTAGNITQRHVFPTEAIARRVRIAYAMRNPMRFDA